MFGILRHYGIFKCTCIYEVYGTSFMGRHRCDLYPMNFHPPQSSKIDYMTNNDCIFIFLAILTGYIWHNFLLVSPPTFSKPHSRFPSFRCCSQASLSPHQGNCVPPPSSHLPLSSSLLILVGFRILLFKLSLFSDSTICL